MVVHILRDYNPDTGYKDMLGGDNGVFTNAMYQLSLFLYRVLNFSIVGQTNFNIASSSGVSATITNATNASPIVITTSANHNFKTNQRITISGVNGNTAANNTWYITELTGTTFSLNSSIGNGTYTSGGTASAGILYEEGLVSDGYGAGINFGMGFTYEVSIPTFKKTVNSSDIGKVLVLKSNTNPTTNSGCFKITGINSGDNRYIIDYRSTDSPPAETSNSIDWWLYEVETTLSYTFMNRTGSGIGYTGDGAATNSRILLQSPHVSGWQVRITADPLSNSFLTLAVGHDGNSSGDFAVGGSHTHIHQYLDISSEATYAAAGFGNTTTNPDRITIVGDGYGQSIVGYTRNATGNTIFMFGVPDNEQGNINSEKIFCYATNANGIRLRMNSSHVGMAIKEGIPQLCGFSGWTLLTGTSNTSPIFSTNAGDCPFTGSTELLPIEIWAGASTNSALSIPNSISSPTIFKYYPRLMGTTPLMRIGRSNFGDFTLSSDGNKAWLHLQNGIYLQWNGAGGLNP